MIISKMRRHKQIHNAKHHISERWAGGDCGNGGDVSGRREGKGKEEMGKR